MPKKSNRKQILLVQLINTSEPSVFYSHLLRLLIIDPSIDLFVPKIFTAGHSFFGNFGFVTSSTTRPLVLSRVDSNRVPLILLNLSRFQEA